MHTTLPSKNVANVIMGFLAFRILSVRKEILDGVLKSDLIGFHTNDYASHFLSSCARIFRMSTTPTTRIDYEGRQVHVRKFPIGIDPDKFTEVGFSRFLHLVSVLHFLRTDHSCALRE